MHEAISILLNTNPIWDYFLNEQSWHSSCMERQIVYPQGQISQLGEITNIYSKSLFEGQALDLKVKTDLQLPFGHAVW